MQNLVIVESPAKGKTIEKYLGKDYKVLASYGHVRDLIPKTGAVDADADFDMKYELISRNKKHVDAIVKALKSADNLYLATDPDREGEAISWHLLEHLKSKNAIKDKGVFRVVFHEITKTAVNHAISNPSELSGSLIEAQQARRALDYLVGFNLSPLLWKKVKPSTSAGRVQSPALRLIVEREAEIDAFVPQEYWTLFANVSKAEEAFECKLHTYKSKALKQFDINTEALATEAQQTINAEANGKLTVTRVEQKERKRQPNAPFTTSTLQQEAASKLRFTTRRTMSVAQQLYEGMKLGNETVGLITYMRTDSVTLAKEAVFEIRDVIAKEFGNDNVNGSPRMFKAKSKNAQEAHEAIRPTSAMRTPKSVQAYLNDEQFKLYELIWNRTVASQMIHATMDTVSADLSSSDGTFFRATGSSIKHAGFMRLYMPAASSKDKDSKLLPPLKMGDALDLAEVKTNQHFTEPPPRFGEASLVKTLEEYDIGRPSTYASIISTLQTREYVELVDRRFHPTDIGKIIIGFLSNHFTQYVDYDFTAKMENDLDDISLGKKELLPLLRDFWGPFKQLIDEKEESVSREEVMQARQIGDDPKTGKPISVRMGRYGPFVQLGHRDDEEKPKFASLLPGQKMDDVTLDDALELFKLPRDLGETDAGETMSTNFGRFGPYIRYGSKFVSLPEEFTPYTVTPEDAKRLVAEKIQADLDKIIHNWEEEGIQVLKGRWGPYITDGNKNAKIPKDVEPETLTLPICQEMLEKAPEKKGRGKKGAAKKKPAAKKKAPAKKAAAKKTTAKKPATKKAATKKTAAKKPAAKKPAAKKPAAKKTAAKKPAAKKAISKKATSKKASE